MTAPARILPAAEPTLMQRAAEAARAITEERNFDDWRGPGDRRDLDLWEAAEAAKADFWRALKAEKGLSRADIELML